MVGPLLAVSLNTNKSNKSKKPDLNQILTNNEFDDDIQRLQLRYNTVQNQLKNHLSLGFQNSNPQKTDFLY